MRKNTKRHAAQPNQPGRKQMHPPPPMRPAKDYIDNSKKIGPQFERLRRAILAAPGKTRSRPLSHAEFGELLEFYIDSERRQEDTKKLYPRAWEHLQTCERCRSLYDLMNATLDDSITLPARPPLPFLAPIPPNALWSQQIRSRVGGAPLKFGFIVQAAHLTRALTLPSSLVLRGDAPPAQKSLLLSDTVTLDQQEIAVDVWLYHPEQQNTADIEISAVSSKPLSEPLRVTLNWNEQRYSSLLQNGKCVFNAIPLSDPQNLRDLRVEFEAESPSDSHES